MRALTILALLAPATALAVPMELNHQGRMLDASGVPLDGDYTVNIGLFDAPSSGVEMWAEDLVDVEFDNGYYAIRLGLDSANPLDDAVFASDDVYLELGLDSGPPLPSRMKLNSVPFAIRAGNAATADVATDLDGGVVNASEIQINGTTIIDSTGSISSPGSLGSLSCNAGEITVYDGTDWQCAPASPDWSNVQNIPAGFADNVDDVLDEAAVEGFVTNGALDLASGTTIGGAAVVTGAVTWGTITGIPADLADGDDVLDEAAVEGFVTNGALDFDAGSTLGGEAIATVAASDAAYVEAAGDTMTGALAMNFADAGITFNGTVADAGAEWALRSLNGPEDFQIYEPEDGDKVHLSIIDGGDIVLAPDGATALTASPNGNVDIDGDLVVGGPTGTVALRGNTDGSQDFAVRAAGENFEIIEPEDSNKVHFRIVDDSNVQLRPNNVLALQANANGVVEVPGSIDGMLLGGCPAGHTYQYGFCMESARNAAATCRNAVRACHNKGKMLCPAYMVHVDDYAETGAVNSLASDNSTRTLWLNTALDGWGGSNLYANSCVWFDGDANQSGRLHIDGGPFEYVCCAR